MKRDATDAVISDLVREAFDWSCARCQKPFPERKGRDIHASHFYSRQFNSTRWFPNNLTSLCAACHDYLGKRPGEHADFMRKLLGPGAYDMLKDRNRQIYRYRAKDKKAMRQHYTEELKRIREHRAQGISGHIEIVAYD